MTSQTSAVMPSADFGTRFSAFMIDGLMLFSAQWVIFIVLSRQLQAVGLTSTDLCSEDTAELCEGPSPMLWALLLLFLLVSTVGYHAIFEGRYGATPGKRRMGLVVVDEHGRSPIGMTAGLLRSVIRQSFWLSLLFVLDVSPLGLGLPSILFLALPLLTLGVFVWGAISPDGRAGHDIIAKTVVVRTDQVDIKPPAARAVHTAHNQDPPTSGEPADTENADTENSEESV